MELAARFAEPTSQDENLSAEEKITKNKLIFHELAQSESTIRLGPCERVLTCSLSVGQLDRPVAAH